jgi:hypothetical protein
MVVRLQSRSTDRLLGLDGLDNPMDWDAVIAVLLKSCMVGGRSLQPGFSAANTRRHVHTFQRSFRQSAGQYTLGWPPAFADLNVAAMQSIMSSV